VDVVGEALGEIRVRFGKELGVGKDRGRGRTRRVLFRSRDHRVSSLLLGLSPLERRRGLNT